MADLSDVEESLLNILTAIAYPNGSSNPSVLLNDAGTPVEVEVFRGWPIPADLDSDMANGIVNVSVFPTPVERNSTRYTKVYDNFPTPAATINLESYNAPFLLEDGTELELENGQPLLLEGGNSTSFQISGTVSIPQVVAFIVNKNAYAYQVQAGDTLASIATAVAALINVDIPATANGTIITMQGAYLVIARVGVVAQAIQEISRQTRNIAISLWCATPKVRDNAGKLFDLALKKMEFIQLPDGSAGRLTYVGSPVTDKSSKETAYKRDLVFSVEYGTTVTINAPTITIIDININSGPLLLENGTGGIELEDGSGDILINVNPIYI